MIGVFDSGIGGLAFYRKAKEEMPDKGFIYFSDNGNFPYGEKSEEEILEIAQRNIKTLTIRGAKVILVACNSATVSSISKLRKEFNIPIVGVEPGIKVANDFLKDKQTVMLATKITTKAHERVRKNEYKEVRIVEASELVYLIESKFPNISKEEVKHLLDSKIKNEEVVVLGCTHYHLIHELLKEIYPNKIFIAPEDAIIEQLQNFSRICNKTSGDIFLTSGNLAHFKVKLEAVLGRKCDVRKI